MEIEVDDPASPDVAALLAEHLADMHATSPPESVHALDVAALQAATITFWSAREDGLLLGCGALKQLSTEHGEVKSMRTAEAARGRGIGTAVLLHIVGEARSRSYARLSLETGTQDYFAPAHRLYRRHGFAACGPFADYTLDPASAYFTLVL